MKRLFIYLMIVLLVFAPMTIIAEDQTIAWDDEQLEKVANDLVLNSFALDGIIIGNIFLFSYIYSSSQYSDINHVNAEAATNGLIGSAIYYAVMSFFRIILYSD